MAHSDRAQSCPGHSADQVRQTLHLISSPHHCIMKIFQHAERSKGFYSDSPTYPYLVFIIPALCHISPVIRLRVKCILKEVDYDTIPPNTSAHLPLIKLNIYLYFSLTFEFGGTIKCGNLQWTLYWVLTYAYTCVIQTPVQVENMTLVSVSSLLPHLSQSSTPPPQKQLLLWFSSPPWISFFTLSIMHVESESVVFCVNFLPRHVFQTLPCCVYQ